MSSVSQVGVCSVSCFAATCQNKQLIVTTSSFLWLVFLIIALPKSPHFDDGYLSLSLTDMLGKKLSTDDLVESLISEVVR